MNVSKRVGESSPASLALEEMSLSNASGLCPGAMVSEAEQVVQEVSGLFLKKDTVRFVPCALSTLAATRCDTDRTC
jgi:hypothetical protein